MLRIGRPLEGMELSVIAEVRVFPFLWRVLLYLLLVAAGVAVILTQNGIAVVAAVIGIGLIYAHGVELQHQALHNTGFSSRFWNRVTGFLLGLPMLVSFSDYQNSHLRHHRLLGTADDREFFNYGYDRLTSLRPLLAHLLMVRHYLDVAGFIASSVAWKSRPDLKPEVAARIRNEYCWMAFFIAAALAITIIFRTPIFLYTWVLPLLIAIPTHALIELPEHWGCDHATTEVEANTRTIMAGPLAVWFTNGNNYHIEHHWLPSVPNHQLPGLHKRIASDISSETYFGFFRRFLRELYRNTFSREPEAV